MRSYLAHWRSSELMKEQQQLQLRPGDGSAAHGLARKR